MRCIFNLCFFHKDSFWLSLLLVPGFRLQCPFFVALRLNCTLFFALTEHMAFQQALLLSESKTYFFFCAKNPVIFTMQLLLYYICIGSVAKWVKASFLQRPWSNGFNPHPGHVVASLDKTLYDDCLCFVASSKQQIQRTRIRKNPQEHWIIGNSWAGADSSNHEVVVVMKSVRIVQ